MNRKERRDQMRAQRHQAKPKKPEYKSMTKEERMDALCKNGITVKDLEQEFEKGYNAGFAEACPATFETIYAAVCLVLNEKHKFGRKRCMDVLNAIDQCVIESLTSKEAIDAVYERMGLIINFESPFDRIEEMER